VINVLALPLHLRDVVFLGHVADNSLSGVAYAGWLALAVYLAVLVGGLATLLWRYRWVER